MISSFPAQPLPLPFSTTYHDDVAACRTAEIQCHSPNWQPAIYTQYFPPTPTATTKWTSKNCLTGDDTSWGGSNISRCLGLCDKIWRAQTRVNPAGMKSGNSDAENSTGEPEWMELVAQTESHVEVKEENNDHTVVAGNSTTKYYICKWFIWNAH